MMIFPEWEKQNGLDGLWGIEYKANKSQVINNIVIEYYQTTNQSGPLHGLDNSIIKKQEVLMTITIMIGIQVGYIGVWEWVIH